MGQAVLGEGSGIVADALETPADGFSGLVPEVDPSRITASLKAAKARYQARWATWVRRISPYVSSSSSNEG